MPKKKFKYFPNSAFFRQFDPKQYVELARLRVNLIEVAIRCGFEIYMDSELQLKLHRIYDGKIIEYTRRGYGESAYHIYSIRQWIEYTPDIHPTDRKNLFDKSSRIVNGVEEWAYGSYVIYHAEVNSDFSERILNLKKLINEVEVLFKDELRNSNIEDLISG